MVFSSSPANPRDGVHDGAAAPRHNHPKSAEQRFYAVPQDRKIDLLVHLFQKEHTGNVLVCARTQQGAERIVRVLGHRGIKAELVPPVGVPESQGEASDNDRGARIRVATGVAAHNADVTRISRIINFDVPTDPGEYAHRRDLSAGNGAAISMITFVAVDERKHLRAIEKIVGRHLMLRQYPAGPPPVRSTTGAHRRPGTAPHTHHHHASSSTGTFTKRPKRKKGPLLTVRKKKPAGKLESYSSSVGNPRW